MAYQSKYDIVIPGYDGHLHFLDANLGTFSLNCTDKKRAVINIIIAGKDYALFTGKISEKFAGDLDIRLVLFEDLIMRYEGYTPDCDELLDKCGRFNYQSLKKMYGILNCTSDYVAVFDSECMFVRRMSIVEYVEENKLRHFYTSRIKPRPMSHARGMQINNNSVLGISSPYWYLDVYMWIFERKVMEDLRQFMKGRRGKLTEITTDFFIECCYYLYYEKNQSKYVSVSRQDTLQMVKSNMSDREFGYWLEHTHNWSIFEHCGMQLLNTDRVIITSKVFENCKMPVFRMSMGASAINTSMFLCVTSEVKICVSEYSEPIYKLIMAGFFNRKFHVYSSGIVRSIDNIALSKKAFSAVEINGSLNCHLSFESTSKISKFCELVSPRRLSIDNDKYVIANVNKYNIAKRVVENTYKMFGKKRTLLNMVTDDEDHKNAYIIYMRPDITGLTVYDFLPAIIQDVIDDKDQSNIIYLPNRYNSIGVTDMVAIGTVDVIKKYFRMNDSLQTAVDKYYFNPELLTYRLIKMQGLDINFFAAKFRVNHHSIRCDAEWWCVDTYGIKIDDVYKYSTEDSAIATSSVQTLFCSNLGGKYHTIRHRESSKYIYVPEDESITSDDSNASLFMINRHPTGKATICLKTDKPNMNKSPDGWNIFSVPDSNIMYGRGNAGAWAQFYLICEDDFYYILSGHKGINYHDSFGRYVGMINGNIVTDLDKCPAAQWTLKEV